MANGPAPLASSTTAKLLTVKQAEAMKESARKSFLLEIYSSAFSSYRDKLATECDRDIVVFRRTLFKIK